MINNAAVLYLYASYFHEVDEERRGLIRGDRRGVDVGGNERETGGDHGGNEREKWSLKKKGRRWW